MEEKKDNSKLLSLVKKKTSELLKLMAVKPTSLKVLEDEGEVIHIDLEYDKPAILIGFKGETLSSLQLIISLIIYKKLGFWKRIVVNIGDWRQKKEESLKKLALNAAEKVKTTGQEVVMSFLNPSERRIIHMVLASDSKVCTESQGEGRERRLIIKPKS